MDTENRLTAVRGEGAGGWVRKVKGLHKEKERLMDADNSTVISGGKGVLRGGEGR